LDVLREAQEYDGDPHDLNGHQTNRLCGTTMTPNSRLSAVVLAIALLLPVALVPEATAAPTGDLSIASAVVVQVVPEPRGIVVNKSASVCLTVVSSFTERVLANISLTYNRGNSTYVETGPNGTGVPLDPGINTVFVPGGNCTAHPLNWTSYPAVLIWNSTGIDSTVMAEVDVDDSIAETDEANNAFVMSPIDVWMPRTLRILVVPICNAEYRDRLGRGPAAFSLDEEIHDLMEIYPLADDGLEIVEAPPKYEYYDFGDRTDCGRIALNLSAEARILGYDRVVAVFDIIRDIWGIETYGCAVGSLSEPRDPVPLLITISGMAEREGLLAHELGHTYYLWHPHDIGLDIYGATKYSATERQYGLPANTIMCYPDPGSLPEGIPVTPRWIDNERYDDYSKSWIDLRSRYSGLEGIWEWNLFSQLVHAAPTLSSIVVVEGSILRTGAVLFPHPWFAVPLGNPEEQNIPQQGPGGMYAVRTLNSLRNVLGNTYFNASFSRLTHSEGEAAIWDTEEADRIDFVVNAPNPPGTKFVQIVAPNGTVLAERAASSSVPTVHVLTPNGPGSTEIGQSQQVSWSGADLDGDNLSYFVSYTPDNGNTWIPIVRNLTATSCTWNTTGLAPTSECRIKVMASDGFNTGEDSSDTTFSMTDSAAPTTWVELNGSLGMDGWFVSDVNVSLRATDNSRVSLTEYSLDNNTWVASSELCLTGDGVKTLSFRSEDLAGNIESVRSATVKIDATAPTVSVIYPVNGSSVDKSPAFSWTATDTASGIVGFEVRVNSGLWVSVGTEQQWVAEDMAEGTNTFDIRATDVAGNSALASVEFTYREATDITLWILILVIGTIAVVGIVLGIRHWRKVKD
jgi:hypothetical protein